MVSECRVPGSPCMCIITAETPEDAISSVIPGALSPYTSFMMSAPAPIAACATSGFMVSTLIGTSAELTSSRSTGSMRPISVVADTGVKPGLVDSPPMSMMSAPSSIILNA